MIYGAVSLLSTLPENPVEMVSWLDMQAFLKKLNRLIPGLWARLPSEAQWEYACRAGTTTPFSFGENITPEQVNYDGTEPYAGGKKGEYREKMVPVKALPANLWGLYQMHGNVWEWCQGEWQENLGKSPVSDSENTSADTGDDSSVDRVLRGGSWLCYGRDCRSAIRDYCPADFRNGDSGFRFSLGHELQPVAALQSENSIQPENAPARRGAAQGHEQAGRWGLGSIKKMVDKLRGKK